MKLTVLVPVFNERATILQAIDNARLIPVPGKEIIVIDNGSTDGTRELLKGLKDPSLSIILYDKNYGYGRSVENAFQAARGEYIFLYHSDVEYDYRDAEKMLAAAEEGNFDIVLGSRLKDRGRGWFSLLRQRPEYAATFVSTELINLWYGKKFTDVIGGRLYRTAAVKKVPIKTYGPGFDFEHVSRMCKMGLKVGEISVNYFPRMTGEKKIRFYNMIDALFWLFRVRFFD